MKLRFLKKNSDETLFKPTKKPEKWKKHSVSIFVLATTFVKICPRLIWEFPKLPRYKKGNLGNISQPRPTASASKNFSSVPFFYLGNLGKSQIRRGQILPQTCQEQISKQNTIVTIFSIYQEWSIFENEIRKQILPRLEILLEILILITRSFCV